MGPGGDAVDQGGDRRRSDAGPGRLRRATRRRGRHGGGRRSRGRRGRGAAGPPGETGCAADGHPDARHGRHRGHPPDRRRPQLAGVHVVILTTFQLDEYIFEGLRAGAAGFLVKDTDAAELLRAVRVAAGGEALLSPTVTRRLISEFSARTREPRHVTGVDELTPREREVAALIATGLSNEEIAGRLYVSQSTVKTHANRAMMKLGARDRAQLVVLAYQSGLAQV